MTIPLSSVRVLDLSRGLPGPFCTQILSDYGAEIIKIEDRTGDPARRNHPPIAGESAQFFSVNRNKRSLTLDLKTKEGQSIFKKLLSNSDVLIDGFRPGTMEKLGLGYEILKELNPGLIYCSLTAFGSTGPLRFSPAHDVNVTALAGITELTGRHDGPPAISTVQISALSGALYAVIAVLIALLQRKETGLGQYCDVAMLDSSISLLAYTLAEWSANRNIPQRGKERLTGNSAYFNLYETSDGRYLSLGAAEKKFWEKFCSGIGKPEYIEIHKEESRQDEMIEEIQTILRGKSQQEWMEIFGEEICLTPVLNLDEVSKHPQVQNREMIIKLDNFRESGMDLALPGPAIKFSDISCQETFEFPRTGQHKLEILEELGYTPDEIKLFIEKEII
jgi:crotonobetainyl-CoA:carnitine CoA-transferase CaiB-like acyl-CoA transferase